MKVIRMYDVLKSVKITKSRKDGSVIFIDNNGRVYFIDKKKNDLYDTLDSSLDVGRDILVWVTKELDKVGFVSIAVNNTMLSEYIDGVLSNDSDFQERCLNRELCKDETQLFNYIYNHDIEFRGKVCVSDTFTNPVTLYIRANDTYTSSDSNIKTPTMLAVAREYIVNTYSGV